MITYLQVGDYMVEARMRVRPTTKIECDYEHPYRAMMTARTPDGTRGAVRVETQLKTEHLPAETELALRDALAAALQEAMDAS